MTNRLKLLAAVAAIALPAGMASAQSAAPGGGAARPTTGAVPPPVQTPSTANTATEDVQAATEATTAATTSATTGQPPEQATPQADASAHTNVQANAQAATAAAAAAPVRLATAADLRAGVQVRDSSGGVVGTVESADATGAVVSTGRVRARLALASFGANGQALVISMTRAQLEAAASQAAPRPSAG